MCHIAKEEMIYLTMFLSFFCRIVRFLALRHGGEVHSECSILVLVRTSAIPASDSADLGSCAAAPQCSNTHAGSQPPSGVHIAS
jgi:hypothetical protein